ncbi:MAG: GNAT family N-acetyltransferase [Clostridia bacterium]|nr:GNAT family N-acetyltransferase [Clostridia bacterium]
MTKYFKTNNVIIRKFEMTDVEQACLNLSENENFEETKISIRSAINEYYTDEPTWAVEDKVTKNLVGSISVSNYSPKNKMCNISWIMSYKHWDNKFMKDALTQIFNFLFTKKDIELIECSYYEQDSNTNVILEEIGMTKEATLRDRRINEKTNKKENFVIYSISKQEFMENRSGELIQRRFRRFMHKKTS